MGHCHICFGPPGISRDGCRNRHPHLVEATQLMKFKGTAAMMVAFFSLGIYYFLIDLPAETKKAQEKEIAGKVLPLKTENVSEFSLIKKDQTITLQQNTNNIWNLSQPLKAIGDNPEAESFLSEIDALEKSRVVESDPKNLSQYGLDTPSFKIHIKFKEGKEDTLLLGDDSPMGDKIYLKLKSASTVLLAATSKTTFDKSIYHFRDKTIFNFSSGSITRIQIKRSEHPLDLVREKEEWKISGKVQAKADKDAVAAFLRAIQFSRVKEFVNEKPDSLKPFGLEKPITTLTLEDENKKNYSIDFGTSNNDTYAKKENAPGVFQVDANFHNTLQKRSADFLLKTLIEFEEKDATEIKIQSEKETVQAIRLEKDQWFIKSPKEAPADMATIRSLLFDLKEAKLTEFIKLSSDAPEAFGLNKPKRSFSMKMGDEKFIDIQFGNTNLNGDQVFAKRTGESAVFSVSKETTQKLFRSFHELRNKKLFKFEAEDINKIVIETQQTLFEMQKSGSKWSLLKPEKMEIKEFLGNDLLWAMKGMEFESFVETGIAPESAGLVPPSYKIGLWKTNSDKFAELQVGNLGSNGQQYYAQIEGKNGYYQVKKKYLDSLPLELDRFKLQ
jgi:hypothetical protein